MRGASVSTDIRSSLRRWRGRLVLQRCFTLIAIASLLWLASSLLGIGREVLLTLYSLLLLAGFGHLFFSRKWQRLNTDNFLRHLNRRFESLEESAQLLISPESDLTPMQSLQRQRVIGVFRDKLSQLKRWQPAVKFRLPLTIAVVCLALSGFADEIRSLAQGMSQITSQILPESTDNTPELGINSVLVNITPPAYTGLQSSESSTLDLEIMEGSQVQWRLSFEDTDQDYALVLANDQQLPLKTSGEDFVETSARIDKTGLYRVVQTGPDDAVQIGGIFSIAVSLDQAPDIRMIEPGASSLELSKDGPATFVSQALINDDFGIENVEILASVAKGSGESVKFRDQTLQFEKSSTIDKGELYQRNWDLKKLGMEPGDELYFTVLATDNKQPQANTARSVTLIVRWLDDESGVLAADGLAIDFIPEFFKSQRQIIIDTEQLLEDQQQLEEQEFKEESYSIGHSQADLKQKYGQYLGDEFGEGSGDQFGDSHETDNTEEHDDDHEEQNFTDNTKITSTADILNRYGHNHGDPEIGPITRRNPLALMKRAVSEMWQAERHLMQAEPELALPYEYEAYRLLKLARQADRIYVKRLGFVPPPVSEENRLSGELDDILSYRSKIGDTRLDPQGRRYTQVLLNNIYQTINNYSSGTGLSNKEELELRQFNELLTFWSAQKPALIKQAVTLETLLQTGKIDETCDHCMQDLATVIWDLIDGDNVDFRYRKASWRASDKMLNDYLQTISGDGQ